VTFAKNHWSNQTGQLVQPAQFVAARGGKFPEGGGSAAPAAPAADSAAPAQGAAAAASDAGPYQVFFETGKSVLDDKAQAAVKKAAEYWSAHKDGKIALSGFVDSTGNADKNAELAKERAKAVAKLLEDSGIAGDRIELRKPETITAAAGADQQARRVDITAAK
jgi:cytochrome c oxidase subunit 2